jgi:hypothetical protein
MRLLCIVPYGRKQKHDNGIDTVIVVQSRFVAVPEYYLE